MAGEARHTPETVRQSSATADLRRLPVLIVDCQTTGSRPATSSVLEIGWQVARGEEPTPRPPECRLVSSPAARRLPKAIQRLTGLEPTEVAAAASAGTAWASLLKAAAQAAVAPSGRPLTVVHYARFERGFLHRLHNDASPDAAFPLEMICTHELVKRLLPELPRKGLRAVAGYLGHSVPVLKRCNAHITATAVIWRYCVDRLAVDFSIDTPAALLDFLKKPVRAAVRPRRYPLLEGAIPPLPAAPGIYEFRRSNGDLLYVGKAACLKTRVGSYLQPSRRHPEHILEMLTQAAGVAVRATGSALEAALLESDRIKALAPPYNVALQTGHRRLWYCDRLCRRLADVPDPGLPWGPIPDRRLITAVATIRQAHDDPPEAPPAIVMAMAAAHAPSTDSFASGWRLFRQRWAQELATAPASLSRLGRAVWRKRRDRSREPLADRQSESRKPFEWTSETVANALEGVICRWGHLKRRARWFALLQDVVVVWRHRSDGQRFNALQACGGPLRDGYRDKRPMTVADYDRLRVLTTELRRLVAEERLMHVYLNNRTALTADTIRRLLSWL